MARRVHIVVEQDPLDDVVDIFDEITLIALLAGVGQRDDRYILLAAMAHSVGQQTATLAEGPSN